MNVFVYYNVRYGGFSVKDLKSGRVIMHCHELMILNPIFKVSQAGRKRVLKTKQKNVHAGLTGELLIEPSLIQHYLNSISFDRQVGYNPFYNLCFVDDAGEPINKSYIAWLKGNKVYIPEDKLCPMKKKN